MERMVGSSPVLCARWGAGRWWRSRAVGVVVLVALLGACGGDDGAPPTDAVTTAVPGAEDGGVDDDAAVDDAGVDEATDDSTPVVVPVDVDPCTLLTPDEVEAVTGLAVVAVTEETAIGCVFDLGPEAGVDVVVVVDDGEGRFIAPSFLFTEYLALVPAGEAEVISGVGERAVYSASFRGLAVDAGGGRYLAVAANGGYAELSEPRDEFIELARLAVARL